MAVCVAVVGVCRTESNIERFYLRVNTEPLVLHAAAQITFLHLQAESLKRDKGETLAVRFTADNLSTSPLNNAAFVLTAMMKVALHAGYQDKRHTPLHGRL